MFWLNLKSYVIFATTLNPFQNNFVGLQYFPLVIIQRLTQIDLFQVILYIFVVVFWLLEWEYIALREIEGNVFKSYQTDSQWSEGQNGY